jgi:hypothetical protein
MRVVADNPIRIVCDRCGVGALEASGPAVVGIGTGQVKILHQACADAEYQFLITGEARVITLAEFANEFAAALGI